MRQIRIILTGPDAVERDITTRIDDSSFARITYEIEEDLLQITYSDATLNVADPTGEIFALFEGVQRGDVWEVVAEMETGRADPLWERIFGGIVEVPAGIKRNRAEGVVTLQVYGYAKLLELASAEGIHRDVTGLTATVSSGTNDVEVTAGDTTDLEIGDEIELSGDGKTESQTIQSIVDSTHFTTVEDYTKNHTDANLTLETPYYRNTALTTLIGLIFTQAGITDTNVQLPTSISSVPFLSPLNSSGLSGLTPSAIVEKGGKLSVFSIVAGTDKRYDADSISSGFAFGANEAIRPDWRPYMAAEPASWRDAGNYDDGDRAWDIDGGDYYTLTHSSSSLVLRKNGVNLVTVATGSGDNFSHCFLDFLPGAAEIWVSYFPLGHEPKVKCYDTSGTRLRTFDGVGGGGVRSVFSDTMIAVDAADQVSPVTINDVGPIHLYTADGPQLELEARAGVQMWTFKKMGTLGYFAVRFDGGKTYVTNWNTAGAIVSDNLVSSSESARAYGAVFDGGGTLTDAYVCYGGGVWYAFSTEFSGLVPYADFSGKSCSAAAKELAKMGGCYLFVDEYKTGNFLGRSCSKINEAEPYEVGALLDSATDFPLSEWFRNSVRVSGTDEAGDSLETTAGDTGDTANRLEIDIDLPLTPGFASAIAWAYVDYLSTLGRQIDGAAVKPADRVIRMLDRLIVEDATWRVLRVENNFAEETQTVRLVEEGV